MILRSSHLYYGTRRYPINLPEFLHELPNGLLSDAVYEEVSNAISRATGCPGIEDVQNRITHYKVIEELRVPYVKDDEHHEVVIPKHTVFMGNGYSIVWDHD
jgi:hypothetical protein